jgi:hypothetical protein
VEKEVVLTYETASFFDFQKGINESGFSDSGILIICFGNRRSGYQ